MIVEALGAGEMDDLVIAYVPNSATGSARMKEFGEVFGMMARHEQWCQRNQPERRRHRLFDSNFSHEDERWLYDDEGRAQPVLDAIKERTGQDMAGVRTEELKIAMREAQASKLRDITRRTNMARGWRPTAALELKSSKEEEIKLASQAIETKTVRSGELAVLCSLDRVL